MLSTGGRRLEDLFTRAVAVPAAERAAFLRQACGGDEALRRDLESLLSADDEAASFLESPPELAATDAEGEEASAAPPTPPIPPAPPIPSAGPYRLLREIGRGGMSTVWLAERADDQFRRQVAVKLLQPGMDSADLQRRFRAERQILAGLDHPNIARLYDGGTTADGRPYFVLEHVEGVAIDDDCERRGRGLAERLELFRTVCSAVEFAHRNLIVHRDLKPGNILVTPEGVPKLLDFGIAKLLAPAPLEEADSTAILGRLLTPQYASPEQFRGEPLTTATDVYSLGVLLYRLLAGRSPYRLEHASPLELERVLAAGIPKPSAVAGGPFGRQLAGDLDNIVAMAMQPEPARRYGSVEQLAEDLRRYRAGLPVSAREDTLRYRCTKFVRRHRGPLAAVSAAAALIVGFAVVAAVQSVRAARQADQARQVAEVLTGLFTAADPLAPAGGERTVRQVLDQEAERSLRELAGQPQVQAALMDVIGMAYRNLGRLDRAEPLLRRALAIRRRASGGRSLEAAESLDHLASLGHWQGDLAGGERLYRQALALRRELLGERDPRVLETLDHLGELKFYQGDLAAAEKLQRQVLAERRRQLPPLHLDLAGSLNDLAETRLAQGDLHEAEELARQALAQRRQLLGADHPLTVDSLDLESGLLLDRGEFQGAVPLLREVLERRRRRLGPQHPRVATALANLGGALMQTGDLAAAEPLERQALAIRRQVLGNDNSIVANSLYSVAFLLAKRGDLAAAEQLYAESLAIDRRKLAPGALETGAALTALGDVICRQGRPGDTRRAEPLLREGLAVQRRALLAASPRLFAPLRALGNCLEASHRYAEAEPLLVERYRLLATGEGGSAPRRQQALADLVHLYRDWGRPEAAAPYQKLLDGLAPAASGAGSSTGAGASTSRRPRTGSPSTATGSGARAGR
jgi:serine/threonine-protein kinase